MPFAQFRDHFGDLAERETRTVTLFESSDSGLPAGEYGFLEMYCDERGCDCRRVMLSVFSTARHRTEAVINYGWESLEFYAAWMKDDDPELLAELQGPALNLGSPQSELAPAILALVRRVLLRDEGYVARLKRHYALFREKIEEPAAGRPTRGRKIARNDACPCGSGRKYKKCCLRAGGEPRAVSEPFVAP